MTFLIIKSLVILVYLHFLLNQEWIIKPFCKVLADTSICNVPGVVIE